MSYLLAISTTVMRGGSSFTPALKAAPSSSALPSLQLQLPSSPHPTCTVLLSHCSFPWAIPDPAVDNSDSPPQGKIKISKKSFYVDFLGLLIDYYLLLYSCDFPGMQIIYTESCLERVIDAILH